MMRPQLIAVLVVETAAYAANRILEALFPSAPDDLMAVADAAGVTPQSRIPFRTQPQPVPAQRVPVVHPSLRRELSDENLALVLRTWS